MVIVKIPYLQADIATGYIKLHPSFFGVVNVGSPYKFFSVSSCALPLTFNDVFISPNTIYETNTTGFVELKPVNIIDNLPVIAKFFNPASFIYSNNTVFLFVALFNEGEFPPEFKPCQLLTVRKTSLVAIDATISAYFDRVEKYSARIYSQGDGVNFFNLKGAFGEYDPLTNQIVLTADNQLGAVLNIPVGEDYQIILGSNINRSFHAKDIDYVPDMTFMNFPFNNFNISGTGAILSQFIFELYI